jgi:hypothetical protein
MSSTVAQRPGRLDLELVQGDDAAVALAFRTTAGAAVSLAGRSLELRVVGPGLEVNLDSSIDVDDAADGDLVIEFPAATTSVVGRGATWYLRDATNDRTLLDGRIEAFVAGHAGAGSTSISATVTMTNATAAVTVTAAVVGPAGTGGGGGGVELGETSTTAYRGDRGKTAYDHSQVVSGNPHGTTATDVGADPAGTAAGLVDDLSGVSNQATARTNLGLGTAATAATGDFAATSHTHTGTQVTVDASGFNGNLTTSDDTVQEVAQKLDDLVIPAAGIPDPGGANDDFLQRKAGAWTYRTPAQVKTDLGVSRGGILNHGQNALPSGRYISNSLAQASMAQNFTPNSLWFCPFVAPFDVTIDRLCVEVTTAGAASSLGRIGIYAVTGGVPAALIRDAGTFDGSALGVKELTLDPTVTLSGGTNYAFAFFHNSGSNMAMRAFSFVGAMQLSEAAAGGNVTSPRRSWNRLLTFTTLPDPAGTVTHETVPPVSFYMRGV